VASWECDLFALYDYLLDFEAVVWYTTGQWDLVLLRRLNPMTKLEALELIDGHKNQLLDPTEMLTWTWLRVTILNIPDDVWEVALEKTAEALSR
jgi:hypothetical protein